MVRLVCLLSSFFLFFLDSRDKRFSDELDSGADNSGEVTVAAGDEPAGATGDTDGADSADGADGAVGETADADTA